MKKVCILPKNPKVSIATKQTIDTVKYVCNAMGFQIIEINWRYPLNLLDLTSALGKLKNGSYVIAMYPLIGGVGAYYNFYSKVKNLLKSVLLWMEYLIIKYYKKKKKLKLIFYIYDLPIHQGIHYIVGAKLKSRYFLITNGELLKLSDVLIVFNKRMKRIIETEYFQNKYKPKFVYFEILDYLTDIGLDQRKIIKKFLSRVKYNIIYGGNLEYPGLKSFIVSLVKSKFCNNNQIKLILLGQRDKEIEEIIKKCKGIDYHEQISDQKKYVKWLYKYGHFGVVPKTLEEYTETGTTLKFSSYIAAGLPVLTPENYQYASKIVKKYGVGFVYKDEKNLLKIIKEIDYKDIQKTILNVIKLRKKIISGYFTKQAIRKAIKELDN